MEQGFLFVCPTKRGHEKIDGEREVDVVDGAPQLGKPGALRGEANTISPFANAQVQEPLLPDVFVQD